MRFRGRFLSLSALILVAYFTTGRANEPPVAGRKYLLSVGINQYSGKPLQGPVNDATGIRKMLIEKFGFDSNDTTLLTDLTATRRAILSAIEQYVSRIRPGDLFVFYYSGHGSLWPDARSLLRDESRVLDLAALRAQGFNLMDGQYDSTIVPIDADHAPSSQPWGNMILDDELYGLFAQMTSRGGQVVLLSDSCNSGTLAKSIMIDQRTKFVDPETLLRRPIPRATDSFDRPVAQKASFQGRYLALTSSQDNQFSIDGRFEGRAQGMFTAALQRVVRDNGPSLTYRQLFAAVSQLVTSSSNGSQVPSLDARYFGASLDVPIFSLPSAGSAVSGATLRLMIRSRDGRPIPGGTLALFPRGQRTVPEKITRDNTLAVLRTNESGEALSSPIELVSGEYLVKSLADNFNVFIGIVRIQVRNGETNVLIVLDPQ